MARSTANVKTDSLFSATLLDAVEGISQVQAAYASLDQKPAWASGTGDGQCDRVWVEKSIVLAAAASISVDLYDFAGRDLGKGSGLDAQGLAMALAEIAYISVRVTAVGGAGGALRIGGEGSAAAWNSGFGGSDSAVSPDIKLGGRWEILGWSDGSLPVADTSNHLLKFLGVTAEVTFDLIILGRSA